MLFSHVALMATLASAQNPFTFTTLDTVVAGSPFDIVWAPSTGTTDTVTLVLRQGNSKALNTIATIAAGIQNTGSYIWTPSNTIVNGSDYAFEIVDDANTAIVNYSQQFDIDSPNTVSAAIPSATSPVSSSSSASVPSTTTSSSSSSGTATTKTGSQTSSSSSSSSSSSGTAKSSSETTSSSADKTTTSSVTTSVSMTKTSSSSSTASASSSATVPTSATNSGSRLRMRGAVLAVVGGAVMVAL